MAMPQNLRKVLISCFAGNWLEWYEFAIFGFLTKQISQQFFPSTDPFMAMIMTYSIFATGFLMRPLGAILSGYLGDRHGRKIGLLLSISLMAVPTFCIGILPTFDQVGYWAPALLLLCRMIQGISLGGEFSGSIIYIVEHAPYNRPGTYAVWADFGSSMGVLSATLTTLALNVFLTTESLFSWGWRIPFLFGLLFGVIGYYLRRNLDETAEFKALKKAEIAKHPVRQAITSNPRRFILSATFLALQSSGYYYMVIYLPQQVGTDFPSYLSTLLPVISVLFMVPATFFGAFISDRVGQIPILNIGTIATTALIFPIIYATLHLEAPWIIGLHILYAWSLGLCFGPRSGLIVRLFPVNLRYTGVSLSYNLAQALFGSISPLMCAFLVKSFDSPLAPCAWMYLMAAITMVSLVMMGRGQKEAVASSGY